MKEVVEVMEQYQENLVFVSPNMMKDSRTTILLFKNVTTGTWTLIEATPDSGCVIGLGQVKSANL